MRLVWPRYVFQFDLSTSPPSTMHLFIGSILIHQLQSILIIIVSGGALNVSLSWPAIVFSVPTSIQSDKDDRRRVSGLDNPPYTAMKDFLISQPSSSSVHRPFTVDKWRTTLTGDGHTL